MAHAKLSPSAAETWYNCPGSVAMQESLPDSSSQAADEGTAAHFLAAMCLRNGHRADQYLTHTIYLMRDALGHEFESFSQSAEATLLNSFKVDADMVGFIRTYVDNIHMYADGGVLEVEVRLPIDHITEEEGAVGTSDAVILQGSELQVHDLKYGRGNEVYPDNNKQLSIYALGALREYALVYGPFETVRLVIHQPRTSLAPREWTVSIEELNVFHDEVRGAASEVHEAKADKNYSAPRWQERYLSPGEKACKWCRAKATCPALSKHIEHAVGVQFEMMAVTPPAPVTETTSIADLAKRMAAVDLIEGWCKAWCTATRSEVERVLLAGVPVAGWKLVKGRKGSRAWSDAVEAETVMRSMRLKHDEMYDYSIISPTSAEKVLAESPKRWARLLALISQKDGAPSVQPESDKRPALVFTPVVDQFEIAAQAPVDPATLITGDDLL